MTASIKIFFVGLWVKFRGKAVGASLIKQKHGLPKLAHMRIKTCEVCPSFIKDTRQCGKCFCYMDAKVLAAVSVNHEKKRNEITHCPKGNWGDTHIANIYRLLDGLKLI